jgi:hypothetical protein
MNAQATQLFEKLQSLPPERRAEVENFVDFLAGVEPMTAEEINAEIKAARTERHARAARADPSLIPAWCSPRCSGAASRISWRSSARPLEMCSPARLPHRPRSSSLPTPGTRPAGPALKLLNVIVDKGLQAIL